MPIQIPNDLPATGILQNENIFVMPEDRALTQDIRPLQILLLNLMPTKVVTETQLARLLGNTPLQVELELMQMRGHISKNTASEHMLKFYKTFDEIVENNRQNNIFYSYNSKKDVSCYGFVNKTQIFLKCLLYF